MTSTEYLTVLLSDPKVKYKLIAPEGIMTRACAMYQYTYINDTQECIAYFINPITTLGKISKKIYHNQFCRPMDDKPTECLGAYIPLENFYGAFSLSVLFSFSKKNGGTCGKDETKVMLCVSNCCNYIINQWIIIYIRKAVSTCSIPRGIFKIK